MHNDDGDSFYFEEVYKLLWYDLFYFIYNTLEVSWSNLFFVVREYFLTMIIPYETLMNKTFANTTPIYIVQ
jgi:hypothetical protein